MPEMKMNEEQQKAYDEALRRIKECGSLGRKLDLSYLGLTTLPPEIGQLKALTVLNLLGNHLTTLPLEIGQIQALTVLDISGNQLTTLPPEIGQFQALTELGLYNNQLTTLPPEIGQLQALTELGLSGNQLTMLPPEIGQLQALKVLDLSNNQLTTLPPEIGQLQALTRLDLSVNQLTTLPPEIGQLQALTELGLYNNHLTTLPPEIGQLQALTVLGLYNNQLTTLPPEIGQLQALTELYLWHNQLITLPPEIGQLQALTELYLWQNQLITLPPEIGHLQALRRLSLSDNQLTKLPPEIGQLTELTELQLDNNLLIALPSCLSELPRLQRIMIGRNPLPAELLKLSGGPYGFGTKLIRYWRSLEKPKAAGAEPARRFDEAKLLLVGPGEVGKTWLLSALQGKVPKPTASTKGIEIARAPLDLAHPVDAGRVLHLNCWDFGGQDHFQVTHQIFFSAKALYLLVWKPRTGLDPELVQRLERIELSAGRTARVLIVSTHAEGTVPAVIGHDELRERFGDLIWGFYEVDSARGPDGKGIAELKQEIAKAAAQLEGMDLEFPASWHEARARVRALKQPAVKFGVFATACSECDLDRETASSLAGIMEVQGHAVYFADAGDEALAGLDGDNLVVLDPEWLAKAVGFVIEDDPTIKASGILDHSRLKTIWKKDPQRACPGYERKLHGYLLWLMWKFDIAYKQDGHTSLIPQHIMRNRPDDLYWTPSKPAREPEATLICRMAHDPPVGLIPALTAAVHPLRAVRDARTTDKLDRNWRDGFFLDTALRGDAYVELADRDLRLVVRDKYPANLLNIVQSTLDGIVQVRWPRLELDLRVPCIGTKNGKACTGTHRKSWLEESRGQKIACEDCRQRDLDADKMLDGFDAREEWVMEQLRTLKVGQQEHLAMAHAIFSALTPESQARAEAPCMFTILPESGRWVTMATHESIRITCWCEHPDGPHPGAPIGSGTPPDYRITTPKEWLVTVAPYISWAAMLFKAFVPMSGTVAQDTIGQMPGVDLKDEIQLMNDAAKALPSGKLEVGEMSRREFMHHRRPEIVALGHLHDLLLSQVKKEKRWGGLRPVLTKSGQVLWLCEAHAAIQQPPVQEIE